MLATVSDKKEGVDTTADGDVDYYLADVVTANDYYPGGSLMPGRKYSAGSGYWEQGIFLKGNGTFLVNNEQLKDSIYLWQKTSPDSVECIYESKDGKLKVWNIWRIDNGSMQYGHNGAALYYQEIKNGKKYYCNDGYPDDDFNDLIFSIEIDASSEKK